MTGRAIFRQPTFDVDPFNSHTHVKVQKLKDPKDALMFRAREIHTDYVKGMFTKAESPYYLPQDFGPCFFSTRTDELLAVKLKASKMQHIDRRIMDSFASIPDEFDPDGNAAFWNNFFAVFPSHYTDAAYIGGKLELSSVTKAVVTNEKRARATLDQILRAGSLDGLSGKIIEHTANRIKTIGGDPKLAMSKIDDIDAAKFKQWKESVLKNPSVVRYSVKPISNLIENATKRKVVQEAIAWYLRRAYDSWRNNYVKKDEHLLSLEKTRMNLGNNLKSLSRRKEEIMKQLEAQEVIIKKCEDETQKVNKAMEQCHMEMKAFKQSLVQCDQRNFKLEHIAEELQMCEAKKFIAGCGKKDSQQAKN